MNLVLLDNKKNELDITINYNNIINSNMSLNNLTKQELLKKCEEYGITRCKSKTKIELIDLINNTTNNNKKQQIKIIIEDEAESEVEDEEKHDNNVVIENNENAERQNDKLHQLSETKSL